MPASIRRQTARQLLEAMKDPSTPAIRKQEMADLIDRLMRPVEKKPKTSDPASTEKTDSVFGGLDEK